MIRIAICDDERDSRERISEYCNRYAGEREIAVECKEYFSGKELLVGSEADLLLLDVEMEGMDGIAVKNFLQKKKLDTKILFVSSHDEVISEAFGRHVYGFLKKPLDYEQFEKKMDIVVKEVKEEWGYILTGFSGEVRKIFVKNILYVQAEGKYTKIFLRNHDNYIFSDKSLGTWKKELGQSDFGQCHRSYLVNYFNIKNLQDAVWLVNGTQIPMSRRMEKEFRENYKKYIWRKAK